MVTFIPDDIDWEEEVRIAIEERTSFSPDALTGMEASLRFAGPETLETKFSADYQPGKTGFSNDQMQLEKMEH